jgi:tellurite resistance protein TerC
MIWFWIGFFILVAVLLALDLGVLNRGAHIPTFRRFSGVVYLMYENHWLGARMLDDNGKVATGGDAAIVYLSAYLLEQALSIDNIFVIALLFANFRVPPQYQHRVLFWGILGAVVFRVAMLGGGAYLASRVTWIFYVFGAYLGYQGYKLLRSNHEEQTNLDNHPAIRFLRRFVTIVDGDHDGKFTVRHHGRTALTTLAVCLIVVELTDIVFALDSIPAVLSVSRETFIMVTSNIFAILGLRSLYFVLAGAMAKFEYLKIALAILLILIGAKMCASNHYHVSNVVSLLAIAGIISAGVIASIIATTRRSDSESAS